MKNICFTGHREIRDIKKITNYLLCTIDDLIQKGAIQIELRLFLYFRYFFRYFPVYDLSQAAISSGVPHFTSVPPPTPPSGPRSMI